MVIGWRLMGKKAHIEEQHKLTLLPAPILRILRLLSLRQGGCSDETFLLMRNYCLI